MKPCRPAAFAALLIAGLGLIPSLLSAEPDAAAPKGEAKDYALFMGSNILLEQGSGYYPLLNMTDGNLHIRPGREIKLIAKSELKGFRFTYDLKMSHLTAKIADLKVERGYTAGNDPGRNLVEAASAAGANTMDAAAAQSRAASAEARAQAQLAIATAPGGSSYDGAARAAKAADARLNIAAAQNAGRTADVMSRADYTGNVHTATDIDGRLCDAIEVALLLSTPAQVHRPYIVMVTTFHSPEDKPDQVRNWTHFEPLSNIGPEPTYIHFRVGGLPMGFEIVHNELHLYQRTHELATNLSEKRVEVSREDAYQYALISHLTAHKKDDAEALPMLMPRSEGGKAKVLKRQLSDTVWVRVSSQGEPLGYFLDERGRKEAPAELVAALADFRYLPAIAKGVPIEGLVAVRPIDFL
jgi:hypothetical protein